MVDEKFSKAKEEQPFYGSREAPDIPGAKKGEPKPLEN